MMVVVGRCSSALWSRSRDKFSIVNTLFASVMPPHLSLSSSSSRSCSPIICFPTGLRTTLCSIRSLTTTSTTAKAARIKGIVKFFDRKRGFGYIIEDLTKKEYYVNRKGIIPDERATVYNTFYGEKFEKSKSLRGSTREAYLVNDEIVEFELEIDPSTNEGICVNITGPERKELHFRARRRWNMHVNESYFHNKGKQRCTLSFNEAQLLINKRVAARKTSDWVTADELKTKLRSHGIEISDETGRWSAVDGSISGSCHTIEAPIFKKRVANDFNFSDEYDVSYLPGNNSRVGSMRHHRVQNMHGTDQSTLISSRHEKVSKGAFILPEARKITGSIFIRNLPKNISEAELEELMSRVGKVTSVWIKRSESGLHKGDAVVKFQNEKYAELAIATFGESSSFEIQGRKLLVREDRQKIIVNNKHECS